VIAEVEVYPANQYQPACENANTGVTVAHLLEIIFTIDCYLVWDIPFLLIGT
jgi:hypothetical protein